MIPSELASRFHPKMTAKLLSLYPLNSISSADLIPSLGPFSIYQLIPPRVLKPPPLSTIDSEFPPLPSRPDPS